MILALEPAFYRSVAADPLWSSVKAVRAHLSAPNLPYGWFDSPPGVNHLIGVRWLMSILYPQSLPRKSGYDTGVLLAFFYQIDLSDEQLDMLLSPATSCKDEK